MHLFFSEVVAVIVIGVVAIDNIVEAVVDLFDVELSNFFAIKFSL